MIKSALVIGTLVLSALAGSAEKSLADDLVVIATVKVKAGTENAFKAAAEEFLIPSRKEPENILYQFVQSPSDPTEFATIERWKSQAGIDAHMSSPHMQVFFGKVGGFFESGSPQIRTYVEFGNER